MPETRGEWLVFLVGVLAIGALAGFIVVKHRDSTQRPAEHTRVPSIGTPAASPSPAPSTATTTSRSPSTARHQLRLRLTAKADTWVSVHSDSESGRTLYEGTLAAGASRNFTGSKLWVRFGAAADLSATLNGRQLVLPGGTYSTSITKAGLGAKSA